jgi:predicted branched-subunit amino acid permease
MERAGRCVDPRGDGAGGQPAPRSHGGGASPCDADLAARPAPDRGLLHGRRALALYGTWTASTTLGSILGAGLQDPARWGLDFAFTAVFIVLVMGFWTGPRTSLPPWAVAAAAAIAVEATVPGAWYILAGGLAGSIAGALQPRRPVP